MVHDRHIIGHVGMWFRLAGIPMKPSVIRMLQISDVYPMCRRTHLPRQASRNPNPQPRTWLFSYGTHFSIQKPINLNLESKFHSNSQPYEPCSAHALLNWQAPTNFPVLSSERRSKLQQKKRSMTNKQHKSCAITATGPPSSSSTNKNPN
jgi:hypothetical protein